MKTFGYFKFRDTCYQITIYSMRCTDVQQKCVVKCPRKELGVLMSLLVTMSFPKNLCAARAIFLQLASEHETAPQSNKMYCWCNKKVIAFPSPGARAYDYCVTIYPKHPTEADTCVAYVRTKYRNCKKTKSATSEHTTGLCTLENWFT